MLLRLDTMFLCRIFAEMKELADLRAELGQIAILVSSTVSGACQIYIVTRYK